MTYIVRFASTPAERDAAFAVRRAVFEVEQNVPRPLDRDTDDSNADHVVAMDEAGACVGTGRVVRADSRSCRLGRMAVVASRRCQGVGAAMLEALEHMAVLRGLAEISVKAQLPAESFYANRGYVREGDAFVDEGVPHVLMRKQLAR
jgi:predicted GNAT family N-acyltransferase